LRRHHARLVGDRGKPKMIASDNGTELTSNAILQWANEYKVAWHYIDPGKPVQNSCCYFEALWPRSPVLQCAEGYSAPPALDVS
jgi:transposase InsO family protein